MATLNLIKGHNLTGQGGRPRQFMTDIVKIGDATLYHGDCLEILPTLEMVDAVVTDPPFNVGMDYGAHNDSMQDDDYYAWIETIYRSFQADQIWSVVPNKHLRFFMNLIPDGQLVIIPMMAGYAVRGGWTQKYSCLLASGKVKKNPWNMWMNIRHRGEGHFFREDTYGHPGYTPMPILSRSIETSGAKLVLDPFMGSGTTGVACANLGRKFIGIEIERKYFDIACERIGAAYAQGRLFD